MFFHFEGVSSAALRMNQLLMQRRHLPLAWSLQVSSSCLRLTALELPISSLQALLTSPTLFAQTPRCGLRSQSFTQAQHIQVELVELERACVHCRLALLWAPSLWLARRTQTPATSGSLVGWVLVAFSTMCASRTHQRA